MRYINSLPLLRTDVLLLDVSVAKWGFNAPIDLCSCSDAEDDGSSDIGNEDDDDDDKSSDVGSVDHNDDDHEAKEDE